MKLKRILAGALAAVVSISTVALASLSTASAADAINPDSGTWDGSGKGSLVSDQLKLITSWNGTSVSALEGATEMYITFDISGAKSGTQAYLIYSEKGGSSNWSFTSDANAACPAVAITGDGAYTVSYKGAALNGKMDFLAVAFVDASGAKFGVGDTGGTASVVGVYTENPVAPEPETTEPETTEAPTEAGPVQENIDSIEYNFTVTAGTGALKITSQKVGWTEFNGTADVTGNGDYSIKITGIGATGMTNLGFISGEGFTVTMNNIVVNDKYTFEVGESLTTTTANANGLPNVWNAKGQADVVYTATADGKTATLVGSAKDSVGITLTVANAAPTDPKPTEATTEPETDPQPTDPQPTDQPTPGFSFTAGLSYAAAGDWTPSVWNEPSVEITGEGEYSLTFDVAAWVEANFETYGVSAAKGAEVLLIDIPDAAPYFIENGISIEVTSILCDGDEVPIIAPINQGTLEDTEEMQDWRVSLYNSTNEQGNSIDPDEIYAEDTLTINFKVVKSEDPTEETTEATTEPTTEPCDVTVSLTPDKAYALPGDEVTYTVAITPNQQIGTLQMRMTEDTINNLYVKESFVVDENVKEALGWKGQGETVSWADYEWLDTDEDNIDDTQVFIYYLNGFSSSFSAITPGTPVTLGTFKVTATELGSYTPTFKDYEFTDKNFESLTYGVAATPVEYVTEIPTEETTEAPTEATTGEEPTVAPTEAPVTDPTTVAPTTVKPTNAPDEPTTVATTTAATTTAPTTSGNNGNKNDTPNTGAQAAVGLSIFMAAGLAGVVAIKKRRK